jgi:hypothetical protein
MAVRSPCSQCKWAEKNRSVRKISHYLTIPHAAEGVGVATSKDRSRAWVYLTGINEMVRRRVGFGSAVYIRRIIT